LCACPCSLGTTLVIFFRGLSPTNAREAVTFSVLFHRGAKQAGSVALISIEGGISRRAYDLLSAIAARVTVAHPGRLRLIFRSKDKNDRKDAERLAKLLYLGEAPAVHVPSRDVRTWRELITCRSRVIAKRTRAKNSLRSLLRCAGVVPPGRPALWTKKGLEWLRRLELPTTSQRLRLDLLLEEIESLTSQVRRIEHELNHRAARSPAVAVSLLLH
jgi:transposase